MKLCKYGVNPINAVVEHIDSVTPQCTVEKLSQDIDSNEAQYEDNDLLRM